MTDSTDRALTPSASVSESSNGGPEPYQHITAPSSQAQDHHLDHLSATAAAQDNMSTAEDRDGGYEAYNGGATKRTADGELKPQRGSMSPVKGHSRNTSTMSAVSTISMASTTASTIGDVC